MRKRCLAGQRSRRLSLFGNDEVGVQKTGSAPWCALNLMARLSALEIFLKLRPLVTERARMKGL